MKVHILDDWFDTLRGLPCFRLLDGHDVTVWTDHEPDEAALAARLAEAECVVLFRERTRVTRGLLERLPKLRLISQRGVWPHVDVAACTDRRVLLCSNKGADGANYAAAELTFALILAAMRQLPQQMASAKAGQWQMGVGRTLRGRTLGLYGYGRIGRVVADYARAFGMQVQWWASDEGRSRARVAGELVADSRAAFFAESDVVSLHLRLTPETRGIVTADDLAQMPQRSVLVNTSRAGLIAPGALLDGLNAGYPGMAAVDVFDTEPLTDAHDPLLSHPNLIATPHIGFVTEDEFDKQFADIFEQVNAYAAGQPIHMVNPSVFER
ncbi:D-2-hydroxyacid dehydrogenase family protein [Sagittula stellata]|uniref:D-isomer specific 2-hydroxyacid dehydrogenase n=1 Tax=Sagittula stellata (strain ATCC 700073 / DSM 11524 / E-37) TaxID=388399 RepID=A3JZB0_SAGS3|nr:D-2-hydroxyacid dehydrogenase family protein [Sagittula stellata]EBA09813.1 D-isomer specific 2-hydroxyacid dehydrogenase [Sagittula stellata E-37]